MSNDIIEYKTLTDQTVKLSPDIVRKYLVHGEGKVTEQEVMMFLALCKYQKLNPFLREAYLIKYGSETATIVTGKETFLKRAVKNPRYRGHITGISKDGKIAWAEVHVKEYDVSIRCEVDYDEYVSKKKDGTINKMWREKPRTMLKKVALVQALREAFPEDFGGMYSPEEISSIQMDTLPTNEIKLPINMPVEVESQEPHQYKDPTTPALTEEMRECPDSEKLKIWWESKWPVINVNPDKKEIVMEKEKFKKELNGGIK